MLLEFTAILLKLNGELTLPTHKLIFVELKSATVQVVLPLFLIKKLFDDKPPRQIFVFSDNVPPNLTSVPDLVKPLLAVKIPPEVNPVTYSLSGIQRGLVLPFTQ